MKNLRSVFSEEEIMVIEEYTDIILSDEYDYSIDEFLNIHETFEDYLPYEYDYKTDMPMENGFLFESIMDKCYEISLRYEVLNNDFTDCPKP